MNTNTDARLLILDLDETLVFSAEQRLEYTQDFTVGPYFAYKRPHLDEFLKCVSSKYRLAVWSSSSADYVSGIVENVFPRDLRVDFQWSRERCVQRYDAEWQNYYYVKDLKKVKRLGYDLEHILMVDDTPQKLERNYGNAVYVNPFFGDPNDDELRHLADYLCRISGEKNFREVEKRGWRFS